MKLASKYNLGRMLERRDFKNRFEEGKQIALHEFSIPDAGYDSVVLENHKNLAVMTKFSNLNIGRHLMEAYGIRPRACMTVPLLVVLMVSRRCRMKGNHIGITDAPDDMVGKVMSISDDDVVVVPTIIGRCPSDDPLVKKNCAQDCYLFHDSAAAEDN